MTEYTPGLMALLRKQNLSRSLERLQNFSRSKYGPYPFLIECGYCGAGVDERCHVLGKPGKTYGYVQGRMFVHKARKIWD